MSFKICAAGSLAQTLYAIENRDHNAQYVQTWFNSSCLNSPKSVKPNHQQGTIPTQARDGKFFSCAHAPIVPLL